MHLGSKVYELGVYSLESNMLNFVKSWRLGSFLLECKTLDIIFLDPKNCCQQSLY